MHSINHHFIHTPHPKKNPQYVKIYATTLFYARLLDAFDISKIYILYILYMWVMIWTKPAYTFPERTRWWMAQGTGTMIYFSSQFLILKSYLQEMGKEGTYLSLTISPEIYTQPNRIIKSGVGSLIQQRGSQARHRQHDESCLDAAMHGRSSDETERPFPG